MCNEVSQFLNATAHPSVIPLCEASVRWIQKVPSVIEGFLGGVNWLDRQVSVLAAPHIPSSAMGTTRAFARILPYLGIDCLFPKVVTWSVYGGVILYTFVSNNIVDSAVLSDVENALSVTTVISGTRNMRDGLKDWSVLKTAWGITEIACGGYFLFRKFS